MIIVRGARPVAETMIEDWLATVDHVACHERIDGNRVSMFGLSLGARYGILTAAALGDRLSAAAFGKIGLRQGPLLDARLHEAGALAAAADRITAPLLLHVQQNDEISPRAGQLELFAAFGSADKRLRSRPGAHSASRADDEAACSDFVIRRG